MKEDQTQLITARLEHLQFMMNSGKMIIFRHRSDMFLFALEAYNIARGLSSRYYRLQEDLDIRFFIRFRFDYWLKEIETWIHQLGTAEYRVDDDDFFAEGRAKRLTIVVDRLFGYHTDKIPVDSAEGSKPLPDEEILEPFKAILNMKTTDLVASFREALREVHKYLLKLSMLPIDWATPERRKALQLYLEDVSQSSHVQTELNNYRYFCAMPDGQSVRGQFCYLKQRLAALASSEELSHLKLSRSDSKQLIDRLQRLFAIEEFSPSDEQLPSTGQPLADDEHFIKFLSLVRFDETHTFPVLDEDTVSIYLTRKDVFLTEEQEQNLQSLFALMGAMQRWFTPVLARRSHNSLQGGRLQSRIDFVLSEVKRYNARLSTMMSYGHTTEEIDAFFTRLFSPEWREDYGEEQDRLLTLLENGHDAIKLNNYVRLLREAMDTLQLLSNTIAPGKQIHRCLKDEPLLSGISEDTVNTYYTKSTYKTQDDTWKITIKLVNAVEKEYKK